MFSKEQKARLTGQFWSGLKYESKQVLGKKHTWILQNTGIKGLQLKFEVSRKSAFVILQCFASSVEKREWSFDILQQYHRVIADIAEEVPNWDKNGELPELETMPSVYYKLDNVDYLQERYWQEIYTFFIDYMYRLEQAFLEIKDVLKAEMKELQ